MNELSYVFILIHIFLVYLGMTHRKSSLLAIILAFWLFILIGFNYGGPDVVSYQGMYDYFGNSGIYHFWGLDQLYGDWWTFSKMMNWTMLKSNVIITAGLSVILYLGINKLTSNSALVYSLLLIFPIADLVIQRRNFAAMVFVIYGIHWLNSKYKFGFAKYGASVLIAAGFHQMAVPFLIFVVVPFLNKKASVKKVVVFVFLGAVISLFGVKFSSLIFSTNKIRLYTENLDNRLPFWKAAVFMQLHFLLTGLVYFTYQSSLKNTSSKDYRELFKDKTKFLVLASIVSLSFVPLYVYNSTFFRYVRSLLPAFYAVWSLDYSFLRNRFLNRSLIYIYAIVMFLFSYVVFGNVGFSGLVAPIFNENAFFDYMYMYVF